MTKAKKNADPSSEYNKKISARLRFAISKLGYSQTDVIKKCGENGYKLSRPMLSKMLNEKSPSGFTIANVSNIAEALHLDLNQLLSSDDSETVGTPFSIGENIISNPESPLFDKYIGDYNILMYRTVSEETGFIEGTLSIMRVKGSSHVVAKVHISVDRNYLINGTKINKDYWGTVCLSTKMRALYITCSNEEIGEEVFIILPYIVLDHEQLYSRMGLALVSCAGINRVPTAQRFLVTQKPLTEEQKKYVYGQLLMNRADIRISLNQFKRFCQDKDVPDSFKKIFINGDELKGAITTSYYHINESAIRNAEMSLSDRMKSVSLLRLYSDAPKYTKVSNKTNELLYRLLQELDPDNNPSKRAENQ